MKNIFRILTAIAIVAFVVACDNATSNQASTAEPLTDYSALTPAEAPMQDGKFVCQRPAEEERLFTSEAIEAEIKKV